MTTMLTQGETLKHISHIYLYHIHNSKANKDSHTKELIKQLIWYLSFFWSSFRIQTAISATKAEHACESLAWTGLLSLEIKQFEITISCANNISSIISSYLKLGKSTPRVLTNMYMNIWYLILIAEKQNYQSIILNLNKQISKPDLINEDDWNEIQKDLKSDQEKLLDYLNDHYQQRYELDELKIILVRLYSQQSNK